MPKLIKIDFQPGTSRHKMLQVLDVNGGSVPSRSSLYNLTSGVVAGPMGAPTRASDSSPAYEYQLQSQGFVECDKPDMPRGMGVRITQKGRDALYTADQAIATADPGSPWEVGKAKLKWPNRMGGCENYAGPARRGKGVNDKQCPLVESEDFPAALRPIMDHRFSHLSEDGGKRKNEFHMTYQAEESWWFMSPMTNINPEDLVKLAELTHRANAKLLGSIIPKLEKVASDAGLDIRYSVGRPFLGRDYDYDGNGLNYFDPANPDDARRAVDRAIKEDSGSTQTHFDVKLTLKMALSYPKKGS